ncbi:cysteinyl-tRNA synthetase family protein [Trichomonas vaginalis G3]|uniref:Cysteine--tRNA ligase n=1 Tax=Trichomonas vaginalis (strain ATCC PRA-98 / G3) TaxID=412133 RepID=A2ECS1_TRIV3|nr:cysteinyl-tRNA synthetase family [Trichomonas vaginalis G3]EAY09567.1 cysteinyl-tRNA synthetase family protein [Trichomonas vaginalis G3]KAI5533196.1 cysteinyl-tRNA synthetase family [Trichomonas vaginalis G3]|eukprot:XP_001321790.1 cysteinyl-tRNA synthetase family protein [Trichomonas vaginalis G3]
MSTPEFVDTGIKIYNSLGANIVPLKREKGLPLRCYTCGPTVYSTSHLGHARTYLSFDMIRRILTDYFNIPVQWSMNVTDIDDKIINTFNGMSDDKKAKYGTALGYSADREKAFFAELDTLNIRRPDALLRVSEVIPEIIEFISNLEEKSFAYESEGSVYFDVEKFEHDGRFVYAELERQSYLGTAKSENPEDMQEKKRNRNDFALWKKAKPEEEAAGQYWETKWGRGRPGWHIECSTMSGLFYGPQFDLHAGGIDLRFPHHSNEIAQSQARWEKVPWVRNWMHTGTLRAANGEKMSKSLGNFFSVQDGLQHWSPAVLRMIFCQSHYRNPMDLSEDNISQAQVKLSKITNFLSSIEPLTLKSISELKRGFKPEDKAFSYFIAKTAEDIERYFADDFDIPKAVNALVALIDEYNKNKDVVIDSLVVEAAKLVRRIMVVLGFSPETVLLSQSNTNLNESGFPQAMAAYRQNVRTNNINMLKQVRELAKSLNIDMKKQPAEANPVYDLLKQLETGVKENMTQLDTLRDESLPSIGIKLEDNANGVDFKLVDPKQLAEEIKTKKTTENFKAQRKEQEKQKQAEKAQNEKKQKPKKDENGVPYHPREWFTSQNDIYSAFDENGLPTAKFLEDGTSKELSKSEASKLKKMYNTMLQDYNKYQEQHKQ